MPFQNILELFTQLQTYGSPALAAVTSAVTATESIQKIYSKLSSILGNKDEASEDETKKEYTDLVNDLKGFEITELEQYMTELLSNLKEDKTTNINTTSGAQSPINQSVTGNITQNFN
jgi:hypothetical protein